MKVIKQQDANQVFNYIVNLIRTGHFQLNDPGRMANIHGLVSKLLVRRLVFRDFLEFLS